MTLQAAKKQNKQQLIDLFEQPNEKLRSILQVIDMVSTFQETNCKNRHAERLFPGGEVAPPCLPHRCASTKHDALAAANRTDNYELRRCDVLK